MYEYMLRRVTTGGNRPWIYKGKKILSREAFYAKAYRSQKLLVLYKNWVKSGYDIRYRPTPDRINGTGDYTAKNIRFESYAKNCSYAGKKNKGKTK